MPVRESAQESVPVRESAQESVPVRGSGWAREWLRAPVLERALVPVQEPVEAPAAGSRPAPGRGFRGACDRARGGGRACGPAVPARRGRGDRRGCAASHAARSCYKLRAWVGACRWPGCRWSSGRRGRPELPRAKAPSAATRMAIARRVREGAVMHGLDRPMRRRLHPPQGLWTFVRLGSRRSSGTDRAARPRTRPRR